MEYAPRYNFVFDRVAFRKKRSKRPSINFTCSELAKHTLPPYLQLCLKFLDFLLSKKDSEPFRYPVQRDVAENYYEIIKHPMDLTSCLDKIKQRQYPNLESFKKDIDLIWENCATYNGRNSPLAIQGYYLKGVFDDAWSLHTRLKDEKSALMLVDQMIVAQKLTDDLGNNQLVMLKGAVHPRFKDKKVQNDRSRLYKSDRERDVQPQYEPPSEQSLKTQMTTTEKYELAVMIDTLPLELLGKVLELIQKACPFNKETHNDIPFTSLDNKVLREIQAYVKNANERAPTVRRYYISESIPAEKQLEILNEELNKIQMRMMEKNPNTSSSGSASETDTTSDSDMSGDSSSSSDSYDND